MLGGVIRHPEFVLANLRKQRNNVGYSEDTIRNAKSAVGSNDGGAAASIRMMKHDYKETVRQIARKKNRSFSFWAKVFWVPGSSAPCLLMHHSSPFRRFWDVGTIFWLLVLVIWLPLLIAFEFENFGVLFIQWFQNVWFMIDLVINFGTTINVETRLIASHGEIAFEYLKTWFIIDFISAVPIEEIAGAGYIRVAAIGHGFKLLKMLKLIRLFKLERNQFLAKLQRRYQIKFTMISLIKFVVILLLGAHWLGCLFYAISVVNGCDEPYCSWVITYAESHRFYSPVDGQVGSDSYYSL
mmetsp:Transcript_1274/g.1799  ORF Transcript_1274/g.1799 Transcript_1274/m.1799 type:complete len:297 (-) Transcript_1274:1151-2041(-)